MEVAHRQTESQSSPEEIRALPPLMSRERFAAHVGLPLGVLIKQSERGYWPTVKIGKRIFINVEVVRIKAAERAAEFAL